MEYIDFKNKYAGVDFKLIGKLFDISALSGKLQQKEALKVNNEFGIEKIKENANIAKEFRDEIFIPMSNELSYLSKLEAKLEENLAERDLNQYLFSKFSKYNNEILIILENMDSLVLTNIHQQLEKKMEKCKQRLQMYCEIDNAFDNFTPGRHK